VSTISAEDTEKLFRAVDPEVIPFLTLNFFCGIRRAVIERLNWSELSIAKKRVIVPRYKGKNQKRYPVTLSDNAIEWLKPKEQARGSFLAPSRAFQSEGKPSKRRTRELILAAAKRAGIELSDNGGRHTFISMHVAYNESIDRTALEADTSPAIIKSNYLHIVSKEDAAKFWAIKPVNK
jgi:integrase